MAEAQDHKEWLAQMERESRAKQKIFMDGIAAKLNRPRVTQKPARPLRGAPDFWQAFEWPLEERIRRFTENFRGVGGHVERLAGMADVREFIADKAAQMSAQYVIRQNEPELEALGLEQRLEAASVRVWNTDEKEHWKARAAEADFGVVLADYAAAYTGSITVLSSKDKGRSVSLLPTVLFAIIPVERLKTRLGEILVNFDEAGQGGLPAGIHFISGPSRSADIENDLTIGVHGPGVVYALIVG
ncbi:L-lactate dehydrogenase complex protein LldG [Paenibacillus sp. UNCCL117]|uniref:LutC/YkgG family protein n=1 Tax=unclassified Paenibacillus TaxID=185978 RepID=UPI00087E61AE|nr:MULTISPECIES: LUD domain-containing protein [unclassified Paenibacillus]SDC24344.1 L-lactate dehydrogenase complex protein LldG [Paenibacillus sp. cl123]SFW19538.1 L-lactate dehydrogenase complex protein LldG [Paenibacillus sp. UNCCL117]